MPCCGRRPPTLHSDLQGSETEEGFSKRCKPHILQPKTNKSLSEDDPPPCNSGLLGTQEDPHIILTIIPYGHYYRVGGPPNPSPPSEYLLHIPAPKETRKTASAHALQHWLLMRDTILWLEHWREADYVLSDEQGSASDLNLSTKHMSKVCVRLESLVWYGAVVKLHLGSAIWEQTHPSNMYISKCRRGISIR